MRRDDPKRARGPAAAILRTGMAVLLLALAQPSAAVAQTVQRIAAVVNDEVVSSYDVQQRIAMVVASTNIRDSQEARTRLQRQMLDTLIDERLHFCRCGMLADDSGAVVHGIRQQQDLSLLRVAVRAG